jgi:aminoglycoside phosphotransferase (APT) family kinase protein
VQKTDLTVDLVTCLIAKQFPHWAQLEVRPVQHDGWDNTTFRLGDTLSVRLPSADGYVAQVEKEHRWLGVLGAHLSLAVPTSLHLGQPDCGYPRPWSIRQWIDGDVLNRSRVDQMQLAADLAGFLRQLWMVPTTDAPAAGPHNFLRGMHPHVYEADISGVLTELDTQRVDPENEIDLDLGQCRAVWDSAAASHWEPAPRWIHGDLAPSNLLVNHHRLAAVIDFGTCAVGDPACDLVMFWTYFDQPAAQRFKELLAHDHQINAGTWQRARSWALWKGLITLSESLRTGTDASVRFGWAGSSLDVVRRILAVP